LHEPDASGLTQAKNIGTRHANSEIILFLDDDIILLPGFVNGVLKGFAHGFDGISGVQVQDAIYEGFLREFYTWFFLRGYLKDKRSGINRNFMKLNDYIATNVLSGGLTAYKKEVVTKLWFDENLVKYCLGEDKEFSMRASCRGASLAICTCSQAYHLRHPEGKPSYLQRYEGKTALIKYLHYKFKKITKKKLWFATTWAIIGTLLEALFTSLLKHSSNPIRGAISGIKKSRKNFSGLEFIRIIGEKV
jgi:GT2 family glycosyltransferase